MIELKFKFDDKDLKLFGSRSFQFSSELDIAIKRAAFEIRNTAVSNISRGTRHGKTYKRRGIFHLASKAGEYPKSDTGNLVKHIRVDVRYLEADVGTDVRYGEYLEKKLPEKGGRPWLSRAADENEEKIKSFIEEALKKAFDL